jgi:invasion protein IalB
MTSVGRCRVPALVALLVAGLGAMASPLAQDVPLAGWRVECTSDGRVLDCRAIQQMINREDKQLVAQLTARIAPETKAPSLTIQLPLGISLTEPVQLSVDNGAVERLPVQTCTNAGCIVTMPLKDPFLASLRNGTILKVALQDANKRTISIDVPLLGFGLAFDKATK